MGLIHSYPFKKSYPTRWKRIRNAQKGTVYDPIFSIADWFPTLAEAAEISTPPALQQTDLDRDVNGVSHADRIFLGRENGGREALVHMIHSCGSGSNACGAIRVGEWKLLMGRWGNNFNQASWGVADIARGHGYLGTPSDIKVTCANPPTLADPNVCLKQFCLFVSSYCPTKQSTNHQPRASKFIVRQSELINGLIFCLAPSEYQR